MPISNGKRSGAAGLFTLVLAVAVYLSIGPGGSGTGAVQSGSTRAPSATPVAERIDPNLVEAIQNQKSGVMATLNARVVKCLPDDNEGSRHQRLLLALEEPVHDFTTILVAHNIDLAPRVPCSEEDRITVRGQYEWNDKGGVIHWTHHDPRMKREGGWIEFEGTRYE